MSKMFFHLYYLAVPGFSQFYTRLCCLTRLWRKSTVQIVSLNSQKKVNISFANFIFIISVKVLDYK